MNDEELDDTTRKLLGEADPSPVFPKDEIRNRIRSTQDRRRESGQPGQTQSGVPLYLKGVAALAASLLLFVGGFEYGRRAGRPVSLPVTLPEAGAPVIPAMNLGREIPLNIQLSGSNYINSLTRLTDVVEILTPEEQEQARQVALAVLYGAAAELLRAAPHDRVAEAIFETVRAQRRLPGEHEIDSNVWF